MTSTATPLAPELSTAAHRVWRRIQAGKGAITDPAFQALPLHERRALVLKAVAILERELPRWDALEARAVAQLADIREKRTRDRAQLDHLRALVADSEAGG